MAETAPLLSVKNLSIGLKNKQTITEIISNVSFHICSGETLALLGESGCGKTLTSLALARLLPSSCCYLADSEICLQGENLLHVSERDMQKKRGCKISMIFQEPMSSLNPVLTVSQQIDEVLKQHTKLSVRKRRERILELLDAVGIPDIKRQRHAYPHQLSGGMKQRIMIAIAIAANPDLIIADEPSTALDVTIQAQILFLLKKIQKEFNMGILLISHDLGVIAQMADRVAVMYAGEIVEQAPADHFFKQPLHPYSQKLFSVVPSEDKRGHVLSAIPGIVPQLTQLQQGCRFANRCDYCVSRCKSKNQPLTKTEKGVVRCWRHRDIEPVLQSSEQLISKTLSNTTDLIVNDLKVHFPIQSGLFKRQVGSVKAVDGVSLSLKKGETVALVGESGCGKSTLGKSILQLIQSTGGDVCFQGESLSVTSSKMIATHMQMIFQDPLNSLNPRMYVSDILREGLNAQKVSQEQQKKRINELLDAVGLTNDALHRYPHEFSGGQRQRIGIARALAVNPSLLICDEPTSALDLSIQAQILNLLRQLQETYQLTYLFISHDLSVVAYLADRGKLGVFLCLRPIYTLDPSILIIS